MFVRGVRENKIGKIGFLVFLKKYILYITISANPLTFKDINIINKKGVNRTQFILLDDFRFYKVIQDKDTYVLLMEY